MHNGQSLTYCINMYEEIHQNTRVYNQKNYLEKNDVTVDGVGGGGAENVLKEIPEEID